MKKAVVVLLALVAVLVLATMVATASTGSSAASGRSAAAPAMQAATATPAAKAATAPAAKPAAAQVGSPQYLETCSICHKDAGAAHQASYDELYQDEVIEVSDITYAFKANPDTTTITFKLLQNGQPLDPKQVDNLSIYWVPYKDGKFQFEPAAARLSLKGKVTADGKGTVTSTLAELAKTDKAFVDYTDVSKTNGLLVIYGRDGTIGTIPGSRVAQNKFPFAGLLQTGTVDYVSSANDAGCVKCHTDPYLKHGYIYGQVNNDPKTDFQTCKACHLDNGEGGHYEWQLLVDNPEKAAEYLEADEEEAAKLLTAEEKKLYAYTTSVMNDVHMSHAMEFPYPQSMANCTTCHEGKLDTILADANFTAATCKSCHPVTGATAELKEGAEEPAWDTTALALKTIVGENHPPIDWANPADCTTCHKSGGVAPAFNQIHTGYNTAIFAAEGLKYSDAISVTIDSATLSGNKLNIKFSAAATDDVEDVDVTKNITPTVLVGLYGWDTRDFVFGPHERSFDDNKDGKVDGSDQRNLEAEFGAKTPNPRLTITSPKGGEWEAVADLTPWADRLKDGTVTRLEVGVLPATVNADGQEVAVDATTRTFDIKSNQIDDEAFTAAADVAKCETCHEALATTFHQPSYGGSVVACRMCHITKSGGSHLEMQSRAIDSYVHAIHSMQYFDVADVDFNDPVEAVHYEHHTTMPYPTHGIANCESCHFEGAYEVPDQSLALPAILSPSDENETWDRKIGTVPSVVTGPAEAACGGCHRAQLINEDRAGGLAVLNQHFTQHGYQVPAGDKPMDTWTSITNQVMGLFK